MLIQLKNISKSLYTVKALDSVNFDLQAGEVHALCGENGAGKSTLMNILTGNLQPSTGEIFVEGRLTQILNYEQANNLGISIVYQTLSLIDTLDVAENIFVNQQTNRWGLIDHKALRTQADLLLKKLQINDIQVDTLINNLSIGQKQMIEIAKALAKQPKILILDEPTASITDKETQILFEIIRHLKKQGVGIIYISHRLTEIFELADRVSVLKDGKYQKTLPIREVTKNQLISLMVGREIVQAEKHSFTQAEIMMEVSNLSGKKFQNISFQLKKGEILGLAGLVGAGRTEIARAIFGVDLHTSGEVLLKGKKLKIKHPKDAIKAGIGYLPEERKSLGIFAEMSILQNVISVGLKQMMNTQMFFDNKKAIKATQYFKEKLQINASSIWQKVANLSGGNQQKVVLAKWLLQNPEVLIIDEPTHGIDVGAKFEIHKLLQKLVQGGKSIILISSELTEIMSLADRILVMREGKIVGELNGKTAEEKQIMTLAMQ
jgi:ABC-type sugar transport system ATPase subunit